MIEIFVIAAQFTKITKIFDHENLELYGMYVAMYVCMYMYVCICLCVCMYVCMYIICSYACSNKMVYKKLFPNE